MSAPRAARVAKPEARQTDTVFDPAAWLAEIETKGFYLWIFECSIYDRDGGFIRQHAQLAIDAPTEIPPGGGYADPIWRQIARSANPKAMDSLMVHLRSLERVRVVPGDER